MRPRPPVYRPWDREAGPQLPRADGLRFRPARTSPPSKPRRRRKTRGAGPCGPAPRLASATASPLPLELGQAGVVALVEGEVAVVDLEGEEGQAGGPQPPALLADEPLVPVPAPEDVLPPALPLQVDQEVAHPRVPELVPVRALVEVDDLGGVVVVVHVEVPLLRGEPLEELDPPAVRRVPRGQVPGV